MTAFAIAEVAIRQLQARYVDAIWRKDYGAFANCHTVDCEWRIGGKVLKGRDEVVGNIKRLEAFFRKSLLTLRTPILEVGNGFATGRTYLTEQGLLHDGNPYMPIGISFDRFVDQGDQWRIAWSFFQTHYVGPPDLSGTFIDNPDYGAPPVMPPADAVPVVSSPSSKLSGVKAT
jgi:hypothetical protein